MKTLRAKEDDRTASLWGSLEGFLEPEKAKPKSFHQANAEFDKDDGFEWTDALVLQLIEGLLWHSLKQIRDCHPGKAEFIAAYDWVTDEYSKHEFSFTRCAERLGYDPDVIRNGCLKVARLRKLDPDLEITMYDFFVA